jgi:acyl carrier protein
MTTKERLIGIFREALVLPTDADVPQLSYRAVVQWDSIGHMQLVAAIESAFDVMFETQQVIDMSSFSKALEILQSHGIDITA